MPKSPAIAPGMRKLSDVARVLVQPERIVSTGWHDVEVVCRRMGVGFDEWQRGAGKLILAKRADGKLAATVGGVGMSLPRQVGKTYLMAGLIFALCILRPKTLVLWSAHHSTTHEETFLSMQGFAERAKVKPFVDKVYTGSGDEEVRFHSGSRILFGARERGFGRGVPGVDALVFDEAQILSEKAMDAMLATMNTSPFGLALYLGTPPRPEDRSETFKRMRSEALDGSMRDSVWIECGADPDADPDDRVQWAKANPSFPHRTPVEAFLRLRKKLVEDSFKREALGIWDPDDVGGVIPSQSWSDCEDALSFPVDRYTLGVECGPDLGWASVVLAGQREDLGWHVELEDDQHTKGRGVEWLVPSLTNLLEKNPQVRGPVADVGGPIKAMLEQRGGRWFFKGTRLEVTPLKVSDVGGACSALLSLVVTGGVKHIGQPQLTAAALAAGKRVLGDTGLWVWQRKNATSDITPAQAMTWALWGAQNSKVRRQQGKQRRVVVMS